MWHGDPEPVGVEPEQVGDHVPGHRDGLGLEVVAEAEVAEHLEEAEVAGVAADLLEVGVLAAGPHALLHGGGPGERRLLLAEEVGLERHHARHREEQVGVVRDEAGRRHDRVAPLLEEREEGATELVGGHGVHGAEQPNDWRRQLPRACARLSSSAAGARSGLSDRSRARSPARATDRPRRTVTRRTYACMAVTATRSAPDAPARPATPADGGAATARSPTTPASSPRRSRSCGPTATTGSA